MMFKNLPKRNKLLFGQRPFLGAGFLLSKENHLQTAGGLILVNLLPNSVSSTLSYALGY